MDLIAAAGGRDGLEMILWPARAVAVLMSAWPVFDLAADTRTTDCNAMCPICSEPAQPTLPWLGSQYLYILQQINLLKCKCYSMIRIV